MDFTKLPLITQVRIQAALVGVELIETRTYGHRATRDKSDEFTPPAIKDESPLVQALIECGLGDKVLRVDSNDIVHVKVSEDDKGHGHRPPANSSSIVFADCSDSLEISMRLNLEQSSLDDAGLHSGDVSTTILVKDNLLSGLEKALSFATSNYTDTKAVDALVKLIAGYHMAVKLPDTLITMLFNHVSVGETISTLTRLLTSNEWYSHESEQSTMNAIYITRRYPEIGFTANHDRNHSPYSPYKLIVKYIAGEEGMLSTILVTTSYNSLDEVPLTSVPISIAATPDEVITAISQALADCGDRTEFKGPTLSLVKHIQTLIGTCRGYLNEYVNKKREIYHGSSPSNTFLIDKNK